jgi:hypothetical protein
MAAVIAQVLLNAAAQTAQFIESGESLTAQESADALYLLNDLLEWFNLQELMIYANVNQTFNMTAGVGTYSIGTGQTWDTLRPINIHDGFTSIGVIDYPFELVSDVEYNSVNYKTLTSAWPQIAKYNASYPNASITFWPVPGQAMTATLNLSALLTSVPSLATTINLPPGYGRLLRYALADEMVTNWNIPASQNTDNIKKIKAETMGKIKVVNSEADVLSFGSEWSDQPDWGTYFYAPLI